LFDTGSGELKWTMDSPGYALFSEDGSQILSLNAETVSVDLGTFLEILKNNGYYQWEDFNGVMHEEEYTGDLMELVYRRISAETGEVLEEQVLTKMGCASKGDITSIDGGFRVLAENQWEVNLQTGEIFQCDSETIAATSEQTVSIPCAFAGQDASLETADGFTRLVSNPEGTLILDAGERSLEVSPDGESMVLYAENFTPILIWATDASVLIQEAEKRLSSLEAQ